MNIFRISGDLLHLFSILILLYKIISKKNCAGLSLKTQELYLLIFVTRYIDLLTTFISYYNTIMKLFFIVSAAAVVYFIRGPYKHSYDRTHDTFQVKYIVIPSFILSFLLTEEYSVLEILWTFSIILESVAIMPQLFMLQSKGRSEALTSHYLFLLGGYRFMYILNWMYRYFTTGYSPYNAWLCGFIQTLLYADFMYMYVKNVLASRSELPK